MTAKKKSAPKRTKPKAAALQTETPAAVTLTTYKGFDRDLKCRDFQYAIGGTYESMVKEFSICAAGGFHSVEMPLDAFTYYGPEKSRYAVVEASGFIARSNEKPSDTKIASARITIQTELRLPDLIARAVKWVLDRAQGNTATGDSGHAAATGNYGCAFVGFNGKAKCGDKGSFAIAWFHEIEEHAYLAVGTPGIDGIKADTFYRVDNGKLIEVV